MVSEVDICNMALTRCGVKRRIATLENAAGEEEKICSLWYDQCRDMALRDANWGFAKRIDALATSSSDPPPGWGYSYAYPTACLWARIVTTASGARVVLNYAYSYDDYMAGRPVLVPHVPFEVMAETSPSATSRMIVCDLPEAYLSYVMRVTDTGMFDPLFVDYLALLLALRVGPGLRIASATLREIRGDFGYTRSLAMAQTMNERRGDMAEESPRIAYRG